MEKREEIVHVNHSFYPVIGGMEKVIYELATRQFKRHRVKVITSDKVPNQEAELPIRRIKSIRFFGMPDLTYPLESISNEKSDLFHFHSQNSLFSTKLIKQVKGKKVFTVMAMNSLRNHPNPAIRTMAFLYHKMTVKAINQADVIIAKNLGDAIEVKNLGKEPIIIPDGVDEFLLDSPPTKREEGYVLYLGRLHPIKGIDLLLRASRKIKGRILIAGPGNINKYKEIARELNVLEKCDFMGYVDDKKKIELLDGASVVVIPSVSDYAEAFSITLSEAWSREKTVVASSVGSLKYRIKHGVNGLLVPPDNEDALANAVNEVLEGKWNKLGREGRKEVLSWNQVLDLTEKAYWR